MLQTNARDIMRTYSLATLRNLQHIKTEHDGLVTVFCYIEKKDVNDIFEGRKRLVGQLYQKACELESAADYGQALKYLYFAVILMKSVPEQEIRAGSMNLVLEIPQHISAIIQSLTFSVKSDRDVGTDERAIELTIRRGEKPVRSIEFAFWDGSNQVNVQALDGEGSVRLYGPSVNFTKLDIGVKYSYYESRGELQEVEDLWTVVEKPTFKNVKRILLSRSEAPATEQRSDSSGAPRMELATKETSAVAAPIGAGVQECITLINAGDEQAIRSRYGEDPFLADKLAALVRYNRPRIVDDAAAAVRSSDRERLGGPAAEDADTLFHAQDAGGRVSHPGFLGRREARGRELRDYGPALRRVR